MVSIEILRAAIKSRPPEDICHLALDALEEESKDFERCFNLVQQLASKHPLLPKAWKGTVSQRLQKLLEIEGLL